MNPVCVHGGHGRWPLRRTAPRGLSTAMIGGRHRAHRVGGRLQGRGRTPADTDFVIRALTAHRRGATVSRGASDARAKAREKGTPHGATTSCGKRRPARHCHPCASLGCLRSDRTLRGRADAAPRRRSGFSQPGEPTGGGRAGRPPRVARRVRAAPRRRGAGRAAGARIRPRARPARGAPGPGLTARGPVGHGGAVQHRLRRAVAALRAAGRRGAAPLSPACRRGAVAGRAARRGHGGAGSGRSGQGGAALSPRPAARSRFQAGPRQRAELHAAATGAALPLSARRRQGAVHRLDRAGRRLSGVRPRGLFRATGGAGAPGGGRVGRWCPTRRGGRPQRPRRRGDAGHRDCRRPGPGRDAGRVLRAQLRGRLCRCHQPGPARQDAPALGAVDQLGRARSPLVGASPRRAGRRAANRGGPGRHGLRRGGRQRLRRWRG